MKKWIVICIWLFSTIILSWCNRKETVKTDIISEQSCITNWWIVVSWLWNGLSWHELTQALQSWTLEVSTYAKCPQGTKKIGTTFLGDWDISEQICCK